MELTLKCSQHAKAKVWPFLGGPGLIARTQQNLLLPTKKKPSSACSPRAYLETPDPVYDFFNKVVGALPVIGLLSRILSDDGGIGSDRIQFKEFCTRVYRSFPPEVTQAFFDLEDRHGSAARPQYVLFWCWAAALGAGLLKSEDMMLGATRLRVTFDIVYEEENLNILMDQAAKKRKKSNSSVPFVPYEARAEKALEAICKCCIGKSSIDDDDAKLLTSILQGVFPAADKEEIERLVQDKMRQADEISPQASEEAREDVDLGTDQVRASDSNKTGGLGDMILEEQQGVLSTSQLEEKSNSLV